MLDRFSATRFREGHAAFLAHMESRSGGVPFTGFSHPFFFDDEIEYKMTVRNQARVRLQLDRWPRWKAGSGDILRATRAACHQSVSANLLEHRFGPRGNSDSPLYRVRSPNDIGALESELRHFLLGGPPQPEYLGPRFDQFARYLRDRSLGCKWPFLAYLLFLLRPQLYFPILPGRFDKLLSFYGLEPNLSGRVEWSRYLVLLRLADLLRDLLSIYGTADTIEIQSYMWVVAHLVDRPVVPAIAHPPDFDEELRSRQRRAANAERIGLAGERFVYDAEVRRLEDAGEHALAKRVALVSHEDSGAGFDILSFSLTGAELHIEVKATTRSLLLDEGFWLSEAERQRASSDPQWCVYRVYDIDSEPYLKNLGNVVTTPRPGWVLRPDSWFVVAGPGTDGA